ncbi:MAG: hypothetical protein HKM99_03715 [Flavobacteriaceae bacterium]|nr:hypothetical protein [Flavobacteriaceae bacterium]
MKYIVCLIFMLNLCSCDYFEKRKVSAEEILNESLQSFNWNEVDEFPIFEKCDSTLNRLDRKICFEQLLSKQIGDELGQASIIVSESLQDTLIIEFEVSAQGKIAFRSLSGGQDVYEQIPELDSLIQASLSKLPKLYPAVKRGQQVHTVFKMPLIIRSD